jgi:LuxR family transcriptional regulator, maltose regulon positive regulatory protein
MPQLGEPHEEAEPETGPLTSSSDGETATAPSEEATPPARVQPSAPLVLTKVQAPRLRSALVHRSRLLQRLQEGMEGPLTLLSAPAGFGKTTLLTSWLHTNGTPGAWFCVEPEDNDPVRFFTYLLTALQRQERHLGSSLLPLLQSSRPGSLETVLALLINEMHSWQGPRLVLVLDDYHVITTQAIHQALAYLVEHLPTQMHLVIATRADPPLPLARLRARGQMTELRATDLRFVPEEAEQFLHKVMSLNLSVQESSFLQTRTEGWIAGLQFAALALQGRTEVAAFLSAFTGSHRFVLDYFSEEVLARQTPAISSFLLSTSILERLSGSLCDAVTGQQGSQATLEALEQANLFVVSLDEERHWYRYHHLFAEVLRNRLKQSHPDLIPTLHQRASRWFEQQRLLVEAVQHALSAHDVEHAASLIDQCGMVMISQGESHTLLGWLSALPDALMHEHPLLCVYHAYILYLTSRLQEVEVRLQDAERSLQEKALTQQARTIRGLAAIIRGVIARYSGDLERHITLGRQALELLPETETIMRVPASVMVAHAYLASGDVTRTSEQQVKAYLASARNSRYLSMYFKNLVILAYLHVLQGRLRQAAAIYEEAGQVIQGQEALLRVTASDPSGIYYSGLGDLWREWNQLDKAEPLLSQGMELVGGTESVYADEVMFSYLAQSRLYQARGEYSRACAVLDSFMQQADVHHFAPRLKTCVAAVRAHIELTQGNLTTALHWANTCALSANDELSYPREREYLTLARVRIAQGRAKPSGPFLDDALVLLEWLLADAQPKARLHSVLEILVLKALALHAGSALPTALDTLAQALSLAQPEGYVRLFLDEGAPMLTLLSQVSKTDPFLHGYVQQLLTHAHVTPSSLDHEPSKKQPLVEPLSERELEVLQLMAAGASNEEIAEQLVIAVGTAKRHVSNILAKLAVSNRTQAVAHARDLGLL